MTPDVVHSDNLAIAAVAFLAAALLIASIVAFNLSRERLAREAHRPPAAQPRRGGLMR